MATTGKILVTGHHGQLGTDLMSGLGGAHEVVGFDLPELDICNRDSTLRLIARENPAIVVHAAAYTDVDGCESNRGTAVAVNTEGTRNIAQACRESGARLIYYSTDYVFDGAKGSAYVETDSPCPLNVYGQSKLAGEEAIRETLDNYAVLRIAWVYGRHGRNFVKTMIQLGISQSAKAGARIEAPPIRVVDDQTGNPTWTADVVTQTQQLLDAKFRGLYHATSQGEVTWFGLAGRVFSELGIDARLEPCTTAEFPRPAPRPARSSLENRRLRENGCDRMRNWEEGLSDFLKHYGKELRDEMRH